MTADIHTCSYYCERPECVRRQRDELRDRLEAVLAQQPPSAPVGANVRKAGEVSPYSDVVLVADLAQQPAAVDDEMVSLGGTAPPVPRWLLDAVQHIEQYMDAHSPGDWAIGGIQKRQASEQAAEIEALRAEVDALRAKVAEAREFRDKIANAIGNDQLRRFSEKHGEPAPLTIRMQAAEARAERLAEALRKIAALTEEFDDLDDAVGIANEALERENDDA